MKNPVLRIILIIISLLLIVGTMSGCMSSSIVGKWQNDTKTSDTIEFTKDGEVILISGGSITTGTYTLVGDNVVKLQLEGLIGGLANIFGANTWQYTISGKHMTAQSGNTTTNFTRTK